MYSGKSILAVVPARSGSKGMPNKNLHPLRGVSLIGRAGHCLAQIPWIDARVISTDSPAYIEEALRFGLDAPFVRPPELSTDSAGAVETLQHALTECERHFRRTFDVVLIVEPTSPLRQAADIVACVERLVASGADSVVAVSPVDSKFHPVKLLELGDDGRVGFHLPAGAQLKARQDLRGRYVYRNGVCYALTRRCLMDLGRIFSENTEAVLVDRPIVNVDIPLEMAWAEFLLERGLVPDTTASSRPVPGDSITPPQPE